MNAPVPTTKSPEELAQEGYRRVSNKYRHAARVDRPDWLIVLARELRRSPADFFEPGASKPADHWLDHYLRCYTSDVVTLPTDMPWGQWTVIPGAY